MRIDFALFWLITKAELTPDGPATTAAEEDHCRLSQTVIDGLNRFYSDFDKTRRVDQSILQGIDDAYKKFPHPAPGHRQFENARDQASEFKVGRDVTPREILKEVFEVKYQIHLAIQELKKSCI